MRPDGRAPADTRTMGIVHSALRRDLERTEVVLTTVPLPEGARRRALGDHLLAMMHFLHVHHAAEDEGLWPLVQGKDPSTVPLVERMERDHELITPVLAGLEVAARDYRDGAVGGEQLLDALRALVELLLPHLEREETEAMPVVSATLTAAEWTAWEREYVLKVKSFVELGDEGQWVLDGLDEEGRRLMLGLVPAVPHFILQHGFAGRYRRKAALLWGDGPASQIPSLSLDRLRERS